MLNVTTTAYTITFRVVVKNDIDPNDILEAALATQEELAENISDTQGKECCWVQEEYTTVE